MPLKIHPALRHPLMKTVLLPWLDARMVSRSTLCEYLQADPNTVAALARRGAFAGKGCTYPDVVDGQRPAGALTRYIPCAIWAFNGWQPAPQVIALMLSADTAWQGYAQSLNALTRAVAGDPDPAPRPPLRLVHG